MFWLLEKAINKLITFFTCRNWIHYSCHHYLKVYDHIVSSMRALPYQHKGIYSVLKTKSRRIKIQIMKTNRKQNSWCMSNSLKTPHSGQNISFFFFFFAVFWENSSIQSSNSLIWSLVIFSWSLFNLLFLISTHIFAYQPCISTSLIFKWILILILY